MQITLDVPASAVMADNLTSIMSTLTSEEKVATAVAVVNQILNNATFDAEFLQLDSAALSYARSEGYYLRDKPDAEVRNNDHYKKYVNNHAASKGPRARLLQSMIDTSEAAMKAAITKAVEESPLTKATIQVVSEHLVKSLPDLIGKALMMHVAGNLDRAVSASLMVQTMPVQDPQTGQQRNILTSIDLHKQVSNLVNSLPTALGIPSVQP